MNKSNYKEFTDNHKEEIISFLSSLVKVPSVMAMPEGEFPFGKEPATALGIMLDKAEKIDYTIFNSK